MTNKEVLTTVIEKVYPGKTINFSDTTITIGSSRYASYHTLLFNHDFAKRLWGEQLNEEFYNDGNFQFHFSVIPSYIFHLMMLAIQDDPFKYIEQYLDK